jgi:hypothetical protein
MSEKFRFIIIANNIPELEEFINEIGMRRVNDEDKKRLEELFVESRKPVIDYLEGLNLKEGESYSVLPDVNQIHSKLTEKQAENLRKEHYVNFVNKDKVYDIELLA